MAKKLCPNCGRENPESLSVCQFCQTALPPESTVRLGDQPTKKKTGELEPALPDWLKDLRQQARDSAEEEAAGAASMPKVQKEEPPDLLAGLASQVARSDEEDIPDWLANLSPAPKATEKPASSQAPAIPESDFFSQFNTPVLGSQNEPEPPQPPTVNEAETPSQPPAEKDELTEWFAKASEQPSEPFDLEAGPDVDAWNFKEERPAPSAQETPSQEEDLDWLRNLEAESKKTGELSTPRQGEEWFSVSDEPAQAGSSGQEDLSWLDSLGALPPADQQPAPSASAPGDDLSWLNAFSDTPPASQPSSSQDDLSWLSAFSESSPPSENIPTAPAASNDLSWLRDLEGNTGFSETLAASSTEQPQDVQEPQEDLPHVSPFTPRRTAPLEDSAAPEIPDWLKSATEEPSMPMGPQALDKFREDYKTPPPAEEPFSWKDFGLESQPLEEGSTPMQPEASPAASDSSPLFSQDVDSIFAQDMPDWLSQAQPASSQPAEEIGINAEGGETLSPADLPSWVQAMRPVEAAIPDATPSLGDQPIEREGPLAGFRGVIPAAAMGSLRRPQPIPLTLQPTSEQQASAGILEQLLQEETTPSPLASTPTMISQSYLRWIIAGLLLLLLGGVIFSGTQGMPVSATLPLEAQSVSNTVMNIPDNAPVLVIVDYEPALAGEMEATGGSLLNQLALVHHPYLSFIATSPSGNALVERLLVNSQVTQPGGAGYLPEQDYTNLGYLPGGSSGVLAFLESPQAAVPASPVLEFSEYAAILLFTDHAESARAWVEQISIMKQVDPALASQPLLAVSSAQAGPMLLPYFSSGQINGLINGLANAARYESLNGNRPGMARAYWDAFGVGMMMAVLLIVLGSLWSLYAGTRTRRAQTAEE